MDNKTSNDDLIPVVIIFMFIGFGFLIATVFTYFEFLDANITNYIDELFMHMRAHGIMSIINFLIAIAFNGLRH